MPYPQPAVLVSTVAPLEVRNFTQIPNSTELARANAVVGTSGLMWIVRDNWAEGQNPALNDLWGGSMPAVFAAAVVEPGGPSTLAEAYAQLQAAQEAVAVKSAALAALIPV